MSTFAKDTLRGYYNGDLASLRVICALENNNEIPDYLNAKASIFLVFPSCDFAPCNSTGDELRGIVRAIVADTM